MAEEDLDEPSNSQQLWRYKARIAQNTEPREITYDFEFTGPEPTVNQLRRAVMERAQITDDRCNFLLMSKAIPPSDEPLSRVGLNNDMCVQVVGTRINRSNNNRLPSLPRRMESPPQPRPGHMANRNRDVHAHLRVLRVPPLDNRNRLEQLIREVLTDTFHLSEEAMGQVHFTYENNDIYVRLPAHRIPFVASPSFERQQVIEILTNDLRHFREAIDSTRLMDYVNDILSDGDITLSVEEIGDMSTRFERPPEVRRITADRMGNYNEEEASRRFQLRGAGDQQYYVRHNLDRDIGTAVENLLDEISELEPIFRLYRQVVVIRREFTLSSRVTEDPNIAMLVVFMEQTQRAMHRVSHALHHLGDMNVDLLEITPRRGYPQLEDTLNLHPISQGFIRITMVDPPPSVPPTQEIMTTDFLHNPFTNYDLAQIPPRHRPVYTLNPNAMIMQQQAVLVQQISASNPVAIIGPERPFNSNGVPAGIPVGAVGTIQIETTAETAQEDINRVLRGMGMGELADIATAQSVSIMPDSVHIHLEAEAPERDARPPFANQIAGWLNGDPITPEQFDAVTAVRDGLDAMTSRRISFNYERAFRAFVLLASSNLLHVMAHRVTWPTDFPRSPNERERRRELLRDLLHHIRMPVSPRPLPTMERDRGENMAEYFIPQIEDPVTASLRALGSFGEESQGPPRSPGRPCPRHSHSLSPTQNNHHHHHHRVPNLHELSQHYNRRMQNHQHGHSHPCPVHASSPAQSRPSNEAQAEPPTRPPFQERIERLRNRSTEQVRIPYPDNLPPGFEIDGPPQIINDDNDQRVEIRIRPARRPQETEQPVPRDSNRQGLPAGIFQIESRSSSNRSGMSDTARHLFGHGFPPNMQQQPTQTNQTTASTHRPLSPSLHQQIFENQFHQVVDVLDDLNTRMDQTTEMMRQAQERARAIAAARPGAPRVFRPFANPSTRPIGVAMDALPDHIREQLTQGHTHTQARVDPTSGRSEPTLLLIDPFLPCRSRHTGNYRHITRGPGSYYQAVVGDRVPQRSANRPFHEDYRVPFNSTQTEFVLQGEAAASEFQRLFQLTVRSVFGQMWENDVETLARSSSHVYGTERDLQSFAAGLTNDMNSSRFIRPSNDLITSSIRATLPSERPTQSRTTNSSSGAARPALITAPILPDPPAIERQLRVEVEAERTSQPTTTRPIRQGNADDSSPRQKKKRTEGRRKTNDSQFTLQTAGFSPELIELMIIDEGIPIERVEHSIGYQLGLPSNLRQTHSTYVTTSSQKVDAGTQSTSSSFAQS